MVAFLKVLSLLITELDCSPSLSPCLPTSTLPFLATTALLLQSPRVLGNAPQAPYRPLKIIHSPAGQLASLPRELPGNGAFGPCSSSPGALEPGAGGMAVKNSDLSLAQVHLEQQGWWPLDLNETSRWHCPGAISATGNLGLST